MQCFSGQKNRKVCQWQQEIKDKIIGGDCDVVAIISQHPHPSDKQGRNKQIMNDPQRHSRGSTSDVNVQKNKQIQNDQNPRQHRCNTILLLIGADKTIL